MLSISYNAYPHLHLCFSNTCLEISSSRYNLLYLTRNPLVPITATAHFKVTNEILSISCEVLHILLMAGNYFPSYVYQQVSTLNKFSAIAKTAKVHLRAKGAAINSLLILQMQIKTPVQTAYIFGQLYGKCIYRPSKC